MATHVYTWRVQHLHTSMEPLQKIPIIAGRLGGRDCYQRRGYWQGRGPQGQLRAGHGVQGHLNRIKTNIPKQRIYLDSVYSSNSLFWGSKGKLFKGGYYLRKYKLEIIPPSLFSIYHLTIKDFNSFIFFIQFLGIQ